MPSTPLRKPNEAAPQLPWSLRRRQQQQQNQQGPHPTAGHGGSRASLASSLNDPNTSTLNMSPFQHSKSFKSHSSRSSTSFRASLGHSQRGKGGVQAGSSGGAGTGSTVRPGTNALYEDLQGDSVMAEDTRPELEPEQEEEDSELDLIDRLRLSRNDAMQQHLYSTAAFWGNKAFELTADPNDAFWLAQVLFLTHQFARAERILTLPRQDKGKNVAREESEHDDEGNNSSQEEAPGWYRLTDLSIACRYLAAQCLIRQNKWTEALDLLGPVNPFSQSIEQIIPTTSAFPDNATTSTAPATPDAALSFDGGIKFEASLCHLRGLILQHLNAADKARESFLEALSLDVKCFESLEALVDGNLMTVDEEWNFVQALKYRAQLNEEDARFVKLAYTVRLKKYKHHDETTRAREILSTQFGLANDPDVLFGLADELFAGQRWADCFAVTSAILAIHEGHGPTLPLHLACMHHIPSLHSQLFLQAHELVDKSPDAAVSWYAVGLWYFGQKRWDEARRFFGKSVLLDNRFGPAWVAFAHAYALEGEHDQAITAYSTAQRHFQGTHLPMLFIGMQHLQLSNVVLGREYLGTAWDMCQDDPLLANEMGIARYGEGSYDEAIQLFRLAIKLVQDVEGDRLPWTSTYINLGHALRKRGQTRDAQAAFEEAIDLDPESAAPYLGLGLVHLYRMQREQAVQALHEALARSPGDPIGSELLSLALKEQTLSLFQATSRSEAVRFPFLCDQTAESLDREVESMERDFGAVRNPLQRQQEEEEAEAEITGHESDQDMQDVSASVEMSMQSANGEPA